MAAIAESTLQVLIVDPSLTLGDPAQEARTFFEACRRELQRYLLTSPLTTPGTLWSTHPGSDDVVIFFNRSDTAYGPELEGLLRRAVDQRARVIPIAMTKEQRRPPDMVSIHQSADVISQLRQITNEGIFDVTQQFAQRVLPSSALETVAVMLARTVAAMLQPTLAKDRMRYFISHRRVDGEELAAELYRRLNARQHHAFQDASSVRPGEETQKVVEANLAAADAVIFLDTPKEIDRLQLIYRVRMPRASGRYPERHCTHVLQLYARRPSEEDRKNFQQQLQSHGYFPHHKRHGPYCDAAVLLSLPPTLPPVSAQPGSMTIDNIDEYLRSVACKYARKKQEGRGKELIISGSFRQAGLGRREPHPYATRYSKLPVFPHWGAGRAGRGPGLRGERSRMGPGAQLADARAERGAGDQPRLRAARRAGAARGGAHGHVVRTGILLIRTAPDRSKERSEWRNEAQRDSVPGC